MNHKQKKTNLSEYAIIMIIQLYYQQYTIMNEKNIHNLKYNLWDKKKDINLFIEKEKINVKDNIHTLYKKYSLYEKNLKISKKYFTTYIEQLRQDKQSS